MRLTKREKVLLGIMIFVISFFISFRFIVQDQNVAIDESKAELAFVQSEIARLETVEEEIEQLNAQIALVESEQDQIRSGFLSLIDEQEEIILLLNEFLLSPDVNATSLSFNYPQTEELEEVELYSMDVSIAYRSDYSALTDFLRTVWDYDRKIMLSQLNMNAASLDELSGNFQIRLYDLTRLTGEPERLFQWLQAMEAARQNPFADPGSGLQDRYDIMDLSTDEPIEPGTAEEAD